MLFTQQLEWISTHFVVVRNAHKDRDFLDWDHQSPELKQLCNWEIYSGLFHKNYLLFKLLIHTYEKKKKKELIKTLYLPWYHQDDYLNRGLIFSSSQSQEGVRLRSFNSIGPWIVPLHPHSLILAGRRDLFSFSVL